MRAVGLKTHIWNNNFKSVCLLIFYPFLLLILFWTIAAACGYFLAPSHHDGIAMQYSVSLANLAVVDYWPLVFTVAGVWFLIAYFFQARMLRSLSHAHSVSRKEEPRLYNMLENLCISQGMRMPKLEVIETHARNAYASGIDDRSYTVTVTRGLLQSLSEDEVEAVLAHELTHIINRDVRLLVVSIIFTGMIGLAAQLVWSNVRYNLYFGGRNRRDGRIGLVLLIVAAILGLGYLATIFTRFMLSRRREFMADAGAVELTKNPDAMMRALLRISGKDSMSQSTDDVAMMCTANSRKFMGLFATHPPIEDRVRVISEMTGSNVPDVKQGHRAIQRFSTPEGERDNWINRDRKIKRNPWVRD